MVALGVLQVGCGKRARLLCCNLEINVECAIAVWNSLRVPENSILSTTSGVEELGMAKVWGQCQAVESDNGELLPNNAT